MPTIEDLQNMTNDELIAAGYRSWDGKLMLITADMLRDIPNGETLTCIDGTTAVKGKDVIDMDTRGGLLAYGFVKKH